MHEFFLRVLKEAAAVEEAAVEEAAAEAEVAAAVAVAAAVQHCFELSKRSRSWL